MSHIYWVLLDVMAITKGLFSPFSSRWSLAYCTHFMTAKCWLCLLILLSIINIFQISKGVKNNDIQPYHFCFFYNQNSNKWKIDDGDNFYRWKDFYYRNNMRWMQSTNKYLWWGYTFPWAHWPHLSVEWISLSPSCLVPEIFGPKFGLTFTWRPDDGNI